MRKKKAKERRTTLLVIGGLTLFVALLTVIAIKPGFLLPMPDASYGSSLGLAVSGGGGSCSAKPDSDLLLCDVETDPGSGAGATMVLRQEDRGCWSAKWLRGDKDPLSGCVSARDLLFPKEPGASY